MEVVSRKGCNQSPKAVVLLTGTNNTDDATYKDVYSSDDVARGTGMIVKLLREKLPDTKILLLRICHLGQGAGRGGSEGLAG